MTRSKLQVKAQAMTDVVRKAVTILKTLSEAPDTTLSLSTLSDKLGMNKTTCHRILSSLASEDFVEKAGSGTYRLGIGAFIVGASVQRSLDIRERALPAMRWLHEVSEETVYLCVRRERRAVCIERIVGLHAEIQVLQLGGSLPLHIGAAPRVLLAGLTEEELRSYVSAPDLERLTPQSMVDPDLIRADVETTRKTGVVISQSDVAPLAKAFGVPVRDHTGEIVAALSVSGVSSRIPRKRESSLIDAAVRAGAKASEAIGFVASI